MATPSTSPEQAATPGRPETPRSRLSFLSAVGVGWTVCFVLVLILPLAGLYCRAPLELLKSAECCFLVRQALVLSLTTSLITTALTFVIGTPVAYTLARVPFRGRRFLEAMVELPLTMPPVVAGVALLLVFGRQGLIGAPLGLEITFTQAAVVMAQFMVASPYYIKTAVGAFSMVPEPLLQASKTLGAGPFRTFRCVVLPLCGKGLVAGLAMTWARAIGEFGATIMFAGNIPGSTQTMPLAILTTMNYKLEAGIALAVVMLTACLIVFFVARKLLQPTIGPLMQQGRGSAGGVA